MKCIAVPSLYLLRYWSKCTGVNANVDQWTGMDYKHGSQMQIIKNLCTEVM